MSNSLREVWLEITAEDYDAHMAAAGQAQANAALVGERQSATPPAAGARLLVAGAGTGQMFDYLDRALFRPFRTTFSDINAGFLTRLTERLRPDPLVAFETVVDDLEDSRLTGPFALAIVILVLEHVDWRRAVDSLRRLAPRVFVVIQETPAGGAVVRAPVGTVAALLHAPPHAVPQDELIAAFAVAGWRCVAVSAAPVADAKRMLALEFADPRHTAIP